MLAVFLYILNITDHHKEFLVIHVMSKYVNLRSELLLN